MLDFELTLFRNSSVLDFFFFSVGCFELDLVKHVRLFVCCANLVVCLTSDLGFLKDGWESRWVKSDWKRSEGKAGSFRHTAGKWSGDPDDKGKWLFLA